MTKSPLYLAALMMIVIGSSLAIFSRPQEARAEEAGKKTIVDIAVAGENFKTLVAALKAADLVDTMHIAVAPIVLERGERLWESPSELLDRFHLETVPSPSGVTHHLFWRR